MTKRITAMILLLAAVTLLVACDPSPDIPMNGRVRFHELNITVPSDFILDSTQSNYDFYVFEKGFYNQMILLSRKDVSGDPTDYLDSYGYYLAEQDGQAAQGKFNDEFPCLSAYYEKDGTPCYEVLVVYGGSGYAVAPRGGDAEEFKALIDTMVFDSTDQKLFGETNEFKQ